MRIEAVIVCKNYADFLAETLPLNLPYFDHIVVVTHWTDKETIGVCAKYSVDCVQAHVFDEDGDRFNKGRAVNVGLAHLKKPDWIVHMDADIVLPHRFRNMCEMAKLNPDYLYGCDRVNVFGWDKWQKLKHEINRHYKDNWFVEPTQGHPVGSRIIHREHGFVPIGFFQMWNVKQHKKYPINEGTAEHSDVLFSIQWHRNQRMLLPEVIVWHLDSRDDTGKMGENWHGRKSPRFGPKTHQDKPCKCGCHRNQYKPHCKCICHWKVSQNRS